MLNVGDVLKSISAQKYQLSPGLLTFHNYLQHLWAADEPWTPAILTHFFNDSLIYPHWLQDRAALKDDLKAALEMFQYQTGQNLELSAVQWPDEIQVIEIEHSQDFSDLINSFLTFQYKNTGSRFRLIPEGEKMIYAIVLHTDRSISVRQFDRRFKIHQGNLEPLRTDLEVLYTQNLELEPDIAHKLEVAPFVSCRFVNHGESSSAQLVRGYIFQKFHEFKQAPLDSYPRLFYTLKRIEQFFVRRESDPFYARLTQELERTLNLLRSGDPLDSAQLTDLQVRTQNALDYVFHGDKLLGLLLRDLDYQMANAPKGPVRPTVGALSHLDFIETGAEAPSPWAQRAKIRESDLTS